MELSPLFHNVRPEGELLPQEAAAVGLSFEDLCEKILECAIRENDTI